MSGPRVLLAGRTDLFSKRGGDTVQIEQTAEALRALGVDARASSELEPDLTGLDVVHLFNLTRIGETAHHFRRARRLGLPCVLTAIHQDLREYHRHGRRGWVGRMGRALGAETMEQARVLAHAMRDRAMGQVAAAQLTRGYRRSQLEVLEGVASVIAATALELAELTREFGPLPDGRVVPLGVDGVFHSPDCSRFEAAHPMRGFILSVGRIEDLKNQLAVLEALASVPVPLVFVGEPNRSHRGYCRQFSRGVAGRPRTWHLPPMPPAMLASAMACARAHVLASWVENIGLVSLEAAAAGTAVVSTDRGYLREYLEDQAQWCEPGSVASIRQAVTEALEAGPSPGLAARIRAGFSWRGAAERLVPVYERALGMR
jgi:glycosyltransferase involved in cell wall biosynthesis